MTYLNYILEANLGLVFFFAIYWAILRRETQFRVQRLYLLGGIIVSLLFPLVSVSLYQAPLPSISNTAAVHWLPEVTVSGTVSSVPVNYWLWIKWVYLCGLFVFTAVFLTRLFALISIFTSAKRYAWKKFLVAESETGIGTFSFFHFIYLGQAAALSEKEKQDMLRHEETHALQWHSVDIVLINLLGILFWFNPILRLYKKSLVQLHEFEADARSVHGHDVNAYCSLLAKTALHAQGYPLANHFTNSFTLKRITMLTTLKTKVKRWKIATAALTIPLFFIMVACQDQVIEDIKDVAKNSTIALDYPAFVTDKLNELQAAKPNAEFVVIEMVQDDAKKLSEQEWKNTLPASVHVVTDNTSSKRFIIMEKGTQLNMLSKITADDNAVFTIVEKTAHPKESMDAFYQVIARNIKYPTAAKSQGIQGRVFVEFIVNTDGSLSDAKILKGIGHGCDEEALRVVSLSPAWEPARQGAQVVRQRMVMPIIFRLDGQVGVIEHSKTKGDLKEIVVVGYQ